MLDYIAMQIRRTNREKGCTWLSVGFLFLLVKCVLECSVDLTWGHFGSFELWTFPWLLSKAQVNTVYPFRLKVGSNCTKIVLTSSNVKPNNVSLVTKQTSSKYSLPLQTHSRFQVHLDCTYKR